MKPELQRVAIAEACGWTGFNPDNIPDCLQYTAKAPSGKWGLIPDYLNDLNAMHDAEKQLLATQFKRYHGVLVARVIGWSAYENEHVAIHATAAQRAEAFLRTIGEWKEARK